MKIVIGIPTGQRVDQAVEVVRAWRSKGFDVCVLTWDKITEEVFYTPLGDKVDFVTDKMESFGTNQNKMMRETPDWDIWICGADDLWPGDQEDLRERIELIAGESRDSLIWVADGCCNEQPTHPIITRKMYDALGGDIFDENYKHQYVDTDLFMRMLEKHRVVKCFDISFDHRHPIKTKGKIDEIYKIGSSSFEEDANYYHKKWADALVTKEFIEDIEIEQEQTENQEA